MVMMLPNLIGAVATFCYFLWGKKQTVWPVLIIIASVIEITLTILNKLTILNRYSDLFTMNHSLIIILNIAIYGLFIFQTITLYIKRKQVKATAAKEIDNTKQPEKVQ